MSFFRRPPSSPPLPLDFEGYQPALRVIARHQDRFRVVALTAFGNAETLREQERETKARYAGLVGDHADRADAWGRGPRGQQIAELVVDDEVPEHACVLRDIPSVSVGDTVRVVKPDLDTPRSSRTSV